MLVKIDVETIIVPYKGITNFIDDADRYAHNKAKGKDYIFVTRFGLRTKTGDIYLNHDVKKTKHKQIDEIFKKVFGKNYNHKMSHNKSIKVLFNKL